MGDLFDLLSMEPLHSATLCSIGGVGAISYHLLLDSVQHIFQWTHIPLLLSLSCCPTTCYCCRCGMLLLLLLLVCFCWYASAGMLLRVCFRWCASAGMLLRVCFFCWYAATGMLLLVCFCWCWWFPMLQVRDLFDLHGSEAHFTELKAPPGRRPAPLYVSTATHIGE